MLRGFLLGQIWTTESCDIPSVFVGSTTVKFFFVVFLRIVWLVDVQYVLYAGGS